MKKITLWLFTLLFCWQLEAQVSAYTFSQSTGAYTEITGETVLATQTTANGTAVTALDNVNYTIALPFDFTYAGVNYVTGNNIYVSTNGFVSFGSTAPATNTYTPISTTNVYNGALSAFGADLNGGYAAVGTNVLGSPDLTITDGLASQFVVGAIVSGTGIPLSTTVLSVSGSTVTLSANCTSGGATRTFHVATGKISYVVTGTAPNRTLIIQYKRMRRYDATSRTLDFQIILNETSNIVSYVYGNPIGSATVATPQVGLRGANNTLYNNRTSTSDWSATTAGTTNAATVTYSSTVLPVSGLTYTWTPPSCSAPSGFNATSILATTATINWSPLTPAPTVGYEYYYSTVNTAPTAAGTATTATTANLTGLMANTLYYVWLRSDCGGTQSAWSGPFSFRTPCVAYAIPYFEGFESGYTQDVSITGCITQESITGTQVWSANTSLTDYNRTPRTGAWNAYLRYGNEDWMFIPINLVGGTSYTVSFYARQDGATATNSNVSASYGTTATTAGMTSVIIPATGIINGNYQQIVGSFTPVTSGTYYIGIKGFMNFSPYYISLDDIAIDETPSCIPPTNLTASTISTTTATINWNPLTPAPTVGYEYYYSTVNTTPTVAGTATTAITANLTGLMANTLYYVWLRSDCGGIQSAWSNPLSFRTPCVAYAIPYFEGFESGYTQDVSISGCITQESLTSAEVWTANTSLTTYNRTPRTGAWNAYLEYGNEDWMFIPVNLVGGTSYTISFYARQDGATATNSNVSASYGTTATAAGMTSVIVPATGIINGNYQQIVGSFTPATSGTYYVGIKGFMNSSPWYISLDDISLDVTPSCIPPTNLTVSNILATTATINWSPLTPAPTVGYEYYYSTVNTTPTVAGTATTAATANLTGLMADTLYYVWLRSDCGGTQSAWSNPFSFRTTCTVAIAPWTYDVETATATTNSAILDCWSSIPNNTTASFRWDITGDGTTPSAGTGAAVAQSGVKYFYTEATSGSTGAIAELYAPLVDVSALTVPSLQFYYHMFGTTIGELHIDVYNGTTWTNDVDVIIGQQQTAQANAWRNRIINLSAFTGTVQVRFRAIKGTSFDGDIAIDDIRIIEAPTCIPPTNLTVSNISTTTATINWIENGSAFDWEYVVQAPGTGVPTGSGVAIDVQPYGITGLTSNTNYEVYIRSVCSVSDKSTWLGPVNFRTPCVAYTIPYFEGFETGYVQDASVSGCLTQESITGTQVWSANTSLTDYNRTPRTGAWNAYLRYGNEDWVFIPINLVGGTSYTISFYARQDGTTATNSNVSASYGTTATAAGMTSVIVPATGIINGNYQQMVGSFTPATSGTYYVGIKGFMNFSPYYISLDDISIDVTPACQDPFGLAVSNLTSSTANISWSATSGNYQYVLDNAAANPTGPGTPTSTLTYSATGLNPSTIYYFHVRTDCGSGTFSNWSTIMFTTPPPPPANDLCSGAQVLTLGGVFADNAVIGTNVGATNSTAPAPVCASYLGGDVWYQVTIPASGSVTIETNRNNSSTLTDTGMAVYSGTCGSLVLVECDDDDSLDGLFSLISLTGRTTGEVVYVRVWEYGNNIFDQFRVSAYDASLSTSSFDATSFRAYPNPVKDILTLEYTTSISSIRIVNLLGQEVLSRNINANSTKIDMSQLNSGAYIVNVVIDDVVQTIKVIKE